MSDKILPKYVDFYKEYCKRNNCTYFVLKGGRGSAKTSHIAISIIRDLMANPVNQLVIRRVARTLGSSVYEMLQWAIKQLKVEEYWSTKGSKTESLMLTYKPKGNRIIFRGALNKKEAEAIRGIASKDFPLCRLWIEELAEFTDEEHIDTIINSVIREELEGEEFKNIDYKVCYSYNPPKRKHSWVNKKFNSVFIGKDYYVQHSTYLDNKYISKKFIERAEHTKKTNLRKYKHQYLGEAIGSGIVPFDNLEFRTITDEEIKSFCNIKQGLDWGLIKPSSQYKKFGEPVNAGCVA